MRAHKFPIGTLVKFRVETKFNYSEWITEGKMYVMRHVKENSSLGYDLGTAPSIDIDLSNCISQLTQYEQRMFLKGFYNMILSIDESYLEKA